MNPTRGCVAPFLAFGAVIGCAGVASHRIEGVASSTARDAPRRELALSPPAAPTKPEEAEALRHRVDEALAKSPELCRKFFYAEAEHVLEKLLARPLAPEGRARVEVRADLVRREAKQFRLVGERVGTGVREGVLVLKSSAQSFEIAEVTEEGLELYAPDTGARLGLSWEHVPDNQAYNLMLQVGSELTKIHERLALAVFAHHRGLETQRENELRVPEGLARSAGERARAEVKRVREALSEIEVGIEGNRR
jgi:hypothetical protein